MRGRGKSEGLEYAGRVVCDSDAWLWLGLWTGVLCACVCKSGSGGGRPVLGCLVYNKRQMSSKMGESQQSAISFRREWTEYISGERYRLLLLLACYL